MQCVILSCILLVKEPLDALPIPTIYTAYSSLKGFSIVTNIKLHFLLFTKSHIVVALASKNTFIKRRKKKFDSDFWSVASAIIHRHIN